MTEKQFWCIEGYEEETSPIVDGKFAPTNGWLCDKLNEFNEENKQLKQSIDIMGGRLQGLWAHYYANRWGIWSEAAEDIANELGFKIHHAYDDPIPNSESKKERIEGVKKITEILGENELIKQENKDLKYKLRKCEDARQSYKQDWKSCSSYCDEYKNKIISLEDEVKGLLEENKELNSIKRFAENNGIDIFNIEEAFRKCWDDNAKLVSENKKLIAALEKHKDDTILSDDKKYAEEREREIHQDRKMPGWMKSGRFA